MLTFYPQANPKSEFYLQVSPIHKLWVAEFGNRDGIPVVFLHGGPGAGCENYHPRFFNPEKYRIILFDQRGAGKSTPHASLEENTTQHLIADIEQLRVHLSIEKWVVFGGSWGSTLGLAYAQQFPHNVLGLILRGIFLCRRKDIQWFYQNGASEIFPDYWQDYLSVIPTDEHEDLVNAYYQRLTSLSREKKYAAARQWSLWEGRTSTLQPKNSVTDYFGSEEVALSLARIECHYFMHDSFLAPDQLLQNARVLVDIPAYLIHGRYDIVCPLEQAYALHRVWPEAEFTIAPHSGHSATEAEIVDALIHATDELAERCA